jgi:hypothetical protein
MKFHLNSTLSDIVVILYLLATLWLRFKVEPQLNGNSIVSILVGGLALLFLWAMIKSKFLRPSYFGLYRPAKKKA